MFRPHPAPISRRGSRATADRTISGTGARGRLAQLVCNARTSAEPAEHADHVWRSRSERAHTIGAVRHIRGGSDAKSVAPPTLLCEVVEAGHGKRYRIIGLGDGAEAPTRARFLVSERPAARRVTER